MSLMVLHDLRVLVDGNEVVSAFQHPDGSWAIYPWVGRPHAERDLHGDVYAVQSVIERLAQTDDADAIDAILAPLTRQP